MEGKNTLYYGDNLEVLRLYVKDESVDLVYLDPRTRLARNITDSADVVLTLGRWRKKGLTYG